MKKQTKEKAPEETLVKEIILSLLSQHLWIIFAHIEASAVGCAENFATSVSVLGLSSQSKLSGSL